jgi:hypothetical protein
MTGPKLELVIDEKTYRDLMATFKTMPKEIQTELRQRNQLMMKVLVQQIQQAAHYAPNPRQATALARGARANKDRIPSITIGGGRKAQVSRKGSMNNPKPTFSELLYGTEFGQNSSPSVHPENKFPQGGRKFPTLSAQKGQGRRGYFIFPTLRKNQEKIRTNFFSVVDRLIKKDWNTHG